MKKYRKGFRWKRLLNKRSRKAIKRQKKARSLKKNKNIKYFTKVIIEAPEILSFLKNLEETVLFFHKVEEAVSKGNNTYLNLSNISIITGDAILYLLSITEKNRGSHATGSIGGNAPLDHDARKYLEASGFYKYVKSNADFISVNQNFFAIRRGLLVEPKTLKEAIQFSLRKCKNNQSVNKFLKDKIYRSLNEATGNIAQHAYLKNRLRRYWWLMVEFVEKEKRLRFYVLDNGLGISETIAKKLKERIFDFVFEFFSNHSDADYILSALRGEFRSETRKKYRGFGLPEIQGIAKNKHIAEFHIISNFGFVDVKKMRPTKLSSKIYGTMLTWEIQLL
ncbi:ATP-binding protein [Leptospira interrogans serovar Ricardi]|uniref:ATP-binding protein n=1 Tax=Leptospira interrogans TaxID=173 RepID=UPI0021599C2B|nr:ATP-binding protein [Leptospira interrogans]MCR8640851.1 ATP-binding protein [Leptospira interrogans serovar Ricardi]